MAGRRTRDAVKQRLVSKGVLSADGVVVIAGLTNGYADYTVTKEECAADTHTYTIMHAAPGLGQSSLGA